MEFHHDWGVEPSSIVAPIIEHVNGIYPGFAYRFDGRRAMVGYVG